MSGEPVLLITGASSGIGAAVARRFAREGYRLVLAARRFDRLTDLADEIRVQGGEALPVAADLSQVGDVQRLVQVTLDQYHQVDLLFNNAGFGRLDWLEGLDPLQDVQAQIQVNLLGLIWMAQAVLPHMIERRSGHIINMGSLAGWIGTPTYSIYAATKFGVRGFTEALRRELADTNVTVRYVAPRATRTGINTSAVERMNAELGVAMDPPELVAKAVCDMLAGSRVEAVLGWPEKFFARVNGILPRVVDGALRKQLPVIRRYAGEPAASVTKS